MKTEIEWLDFNEENLNKAFSDEIKEVTSDHDIKIITNALYLNPYKTPKVKMYRPVECVETEYKIGTSQVEIRWDTNKTEDGPISKVEVC